MSNETEDAAEELRNVVGDVTDPWWGGYCAGLLHGLEMRDDDHVESFLHRLRKDIEEYVGQPGEGEEADEDWSF